MFSQVVSSAFLLHMYISPRNTIRSRHRCICTSSTSCFQFSSVYRQCVATTVLLKDLDETERFTSALKMEPPSEIAQCHINISMKL